jgi:hypothetical protein
MGKILYEEKDIPRWLPDELRESVTKKLIFLENFRKNKKPPTGDSSEKFIPQLTDRTSDSINFIYKLLVDKRMETTWNKLFKIDKKKTIQFVKDLDTNHPLSNRIKGNEFMPFSEKFKIDFITSLVSKCDDLLDFSKRFHCLYSDSDGFKNYDKSKLINGIESDQFIASLEAHSTKLKGIVSFYKENQERIDAGSYLERPISRKASVDNAKALFWAKKIKSMFLESYKKPLNKEIGIMISVLFEDEKYCYDADYIAKITKDVKTAFDIMEDSSQ